MEPENHLFEKENHLNQTSIFGFHINYYSSIDVSFLKVISMRLSAFVLVCLWPNNDQRAGAVFSGFPEKSSFGCFQKYGCFPQNGW